MTDDVCLAGAPARNGVCGEPGCVCDRRKPSRVIVIVQGGIVQSVMASGGVSASVIDHDAWWECGTWRYGEGPARFEHEGDCLEHTPEDVAEYVALVAEADGLSDAY